MNFNIPTKIVLLFSLLCLNKTLMAQNLETIYINELVSTHFITSEPIEYVDISTDDIAGDLPLANILRLKPNKKDSATDNRDAIVTIVCQSYLVQFGLKSGDLHAATKSRFISSKDGRGLLMPEITISASEMKNISMQVLNEKQKGFITQVKDQKLKMKLNKVYVYGDYYFLDVSVQNNNLIPYEIDQVLFSVIDKKALKATNSQEIMLEPEFKLYHQQRIRRKYRNVFVLKKFTFPKDKIFRIRMTEKQLSGRSITLEEDYRLIQQTEPI